MHIAVLLYGRINRYKYFFEHIVNSIGNHTFDIFLSSDNPSKEDIDGFIKLYNPTSYIIEPVTYTSDLAKYKLHREETNIHNMTCHFVNLKRVFSLLETHIDSTYTHYDIILSQRIDNVYKSTFNFIIPAINTIYIPKGFDFIQNAVNDNVAYGDMNSMKIYMNIYDNIHAIIRSGMSVIHPESLTYANIVFNNLNIVRVDVTFLIEMWSKWEELKYINDIINLPDAKLLELDSICGFTTLHFLTTNSTLTLTSFSKISPQVYSLIQKKFIDRYSFIAGNTLFNFTYLVLSSPSITFDIIYIDEPDTYNLKEYLVSSRKLANKDTIIILNNVLNNSEYKREWNIAPTNAWNDAIAEGILVETSHIDYTIGRGMAWGKYVFHDKS